MGNRRVSQLSSLTWNQVASNDLFLIADVSAVQSKKIQADELQKYVLNNRNLTGSLFGTASYSLQALSASWSPAQSSASYSLSSSYANFAALAMSVMSASYALSASYAFSSSYALSASYASTSSVQMVVSSAKATTSDTASFLIYTAGRYNGRIFNSDTASFLSYTGANTGTASYAMMARSASFAHTASLVRSASFLVYDGVTNNGTASYAWTARSASNATTVTSIANNYIYREFDIVTSSILNTNIASFGWMQFTSSFWGDANVIVEAYGDVVVPLSESADYSGSLQLIMENATTYLELDKSNFQYYYTSSTNESTGSMICPFYLKGKFVVSSPVNQRLSGSVLARNGLTFNTSSRGVRCTIKATTDNFVDE